jgi:HSP90 family molecular chaperone
MMHFSKAEEQPEIIIEAEKKQPSFSQSEQREFRAETRKLLDIVAKSIYTDKEVFLRELLSNCSDALEKQRFEVLRGESVMGEGDDLGIQIHTNSKERTITIFDSGIGMDRNEVIENLGTIAKSGSQAFVKSLEDDEPVSDSIIG